MEADVAKLLTGFEKLAAWRPNTLPTSMVFLGALGALGFYWIAVHHGSPSVSPTALSLILGCGIFSALGAILYLDKVGARILSGNFSKLPSISYFSGCAFVVCVFYVFVPVAMPSWMTFSFVVLSVLSGCLLSAHLNRQASWHSIFLGAAPGSDRTLPDVGVAAGAGRTIALVLILLTPLVALSPYLAASLPIETDTSPTLAYYATGEFSPYRQGGSFFWLPQFNFGTPRLGNFFFSSFLNPLNYFGAVFPEPYLSYVAWYISIAVGLYGGFRLFALFTPDAVVAMTAGLVLMFGGAFFTVFIAFETPVPLALSIWTIFFVERSIRNRRQSRTSAKDIVWAAALHSLSFFIFARHFWFYLSYILFFYILIRSFSYAKSRTRQDFANDALFAVKTGLIFFGAATALSAVTMIPTVVLLKFLSHAGREINEYIYSHALDVAELYFFPFFFPDVYQGQWHPSRFYAQSYLGVIPLFFVYVWVRDKGLRKAALVLVLLFVIVQAAGSKDPADYVLRLNPVASTMRSTSYWLLAWNLVIIIIMVKGMEIVRREIDYSRVGKYLMQYFIFVSLCGVLLGIFDSTKAGYLGAWERVAGLEIKFAGYFDGFEWKGIATPLLIILALGSFFIVPGEFKKKRSGFVWVVFFLCAADILRVAMKEPYRMVDVRKETMREDAERADGRGREELMGLGGGLGRGRVLSFVIGRACGMLSVSERQIEVVNPRTSINLERGILGWMLLGPFLEDTQGCFGKIPSTGIEEFVRSAKLSAARALNVKYYLSEKPLSQHTLRDIGFEEAARKPGNRIYLFEDKRAFPRAVVYFGARTVRDPSAAYKVIKGNMVNLLQEAVVEVRPSDTVARRLEAWRKREPNAPIFGTVTVYRPEEVVVEVDLHQSGLLVVSDVLYPGWIAEDNGTPVNMVPTNIVGRGVFLEPGHHQVRFSYRPTFFYIGVAISAISICLIFLLQFFLSRRPRPRRAS